MVTLAALVTALATLLSVTLNTVITLRGQRDTTRRLDDVHDEVRTINGQSLGDLADADEGRRIEEDIPHADRTTSEQGYVDRLK